MARHKMLRAVREFFFGRQYLEVETPNLMATVAPDPNIDPLTVYVADKGPFYLHTSPEIHMKRLLPVIDDGIFQICKVYRVEEFEEVHSIEFTMLEWYRKGTYLDLMEEVEELVGSVAQTLTSHPQGPFSRPFPVYDLAQLCVEKAGIDPFPLDREWFLAELRKKDFHGVDERDTWNDLFFKLFIQEVEPAIGKGRAYFIKDWPKSISTMARMKDAHRVERFELYINGLEIANGYTELLDAKEQNDRFLRDNEERKILGKRTFLPDEGLLRALDHLSGPYAGVSVGMDRLLMVMLGKSHIKDVLVNRFTIPRKDKAQGVSVGEPPHE